MKRKGNAPISTSMKKKKKNNNYFRQDISLLSKLRIIYQNVEDNKKILAIEQFASPKFCKELIKIAENVGFNGAQNKKYTQSTVDIEVDGAPSLKKFILAKTKLIVPLTQAFNIYKKGMKPYAFDDLFIVKYDANIQRELVKHYDGGEISFMLALSERFDYTGGGTKFDVCPAVEHLNIGDLMLFNADMYHAGLPIGKGLRYLLVGFCFITPETIRIEGNLNFHHLYGV